MYGTRPPPGPGRDGGAEQGRLQPGGPSASKAPAQAPIQQDSCYQSKDGLSPSWSGLVMPCGASYLTPTATLPEGHHDLVFQMRKLRLGDVSMVARGHTVNMRQTWDLSPKGLAL